MACLRRVRSLPFPSRLPAEESTMATPDLRPVLLVVGNGMVGHHFLEAAVERDLHREYRIVVLGEERHRAYDRVHLTTAFEGADPGALCLGAPDFYEANGIHLVLERPRRDARPRRPGRHHRVGSAGRLRPHGPGHGQRAVRATRSRAATSPACSCTGRSTTSTPSAPGPPGASGVSWSAAASSGSRRPGRCGRSGCRPRWSSSPGTSCPCRSTPRPAGPCAGGSRTWASTCGPGPPRPRSSPPMTAGPPAWRSPPPPTAARRRLRSTPRS